MKIMPSLRDFLNRTIVGKITETKIPNTRDHIAELSLLKLAWQAGIPIRRLVERDLRDFITES